MTWQQWTIAILMVIGFFNNVQGITKDKSLPSNAAALLILFAVAFTVGEALVLSSGGFW